MDQFISHSRWRREAWKGHDSKKNVRSAIRYAKQHNADLCIFVRGDAGYVEIPASEWAAYFAEGA